MQLTVRQAKNATCVDGFGDGLFHCRTKTVRLQIATPNPAVHSLAFQDIQNQSTQRLDCLIDDLTLEQVSPDGGHSTVSS